MAEWFKHDYGSRKDEKILNLIMDLGYEGFGIYWALVEIAYERDGRIHEDSIVGIAFDMHTQCERITDVLEKYDLFYQEDEYYLSEGINKRLEERYSKTESAKKGAKVRWDKVKDQQLNANALHEQCTTNAIREEEIRLDKKKEKELNKKKFADFVSLTEDEYSTLIAKYGDKFTLKCIEILDNYKGANGKKYSSDYRAILSWVVSRVTKEYPKLVKDARPTFVA